jgi:hypothetical protein
MAVSMTRGVGFVVQGFRGEVSGDGWIDISVSWGMGGMVCCCGEKIDLMRGEMGWNGRDGRKGTEAMAGRYHGMG